MPLYEYRCEACGHRFEVLQHMGDDNRSLTCPRCGAERPERQLSTFASSTSGDAQGGGACGGGSGFV